MKRIILLLLLLSCTQIETPIIETPVVEEPVIEIVEEITEPPFEEVKFEPVGKFILERQIGNFEIISKGADSDNFGFIKVKRYDALYTDYEKVLVHIFDFNSRDELDVVLTTTFGDIISNGGLFYFGNSLALYLTDDDHRVAIWSSGNLLVYVETHNSVYANQEIIEAYLQHYPSDLSIERCRDNDGKDHFYKGETTLVQHAGTKTSWEDVCLRDYAPYRNGQFTPTKRISEEDGLLEGRCGNYADQPGFIEEYECPRGCEQGACV
jgi:hypothetical protein